jgi:ribA/ribD-fused uncharacterized protein
MSERPGQLSAAQNEYCAFFNKTSHAEYDFLSNFHEHTLVSKWGAFRCSEGLYQYMKFAYLDDDDLVQVFMNASGQQAWDISRKAELSSKIDPAWNREAAMRATLRVKFEDPVLKQQLLETKAKYLVENSPEGHDAFWADNGNGSGKNMLGIMLMELRAELGGAGVVPRPAVLDMLYACVEKSFIKNGSQ